MEEAYTGGDCRYSVVAVGGLNFDVEGGRDKGAVAGVCGSGAVVCSSNEERSAAEGSRRSGGRLGSDGV